MINADRLRELRDEIGADDLAEVAEMFLAEAEEVVLRICETGSASVDDMHFLKGSAMNLGLQALGGYCATAEGKLRGDPAFAPDLAAIKALFDQSRQALQGAVTAG